MQNTETTRTCANPGLPPGPGCSNPLNPDPTKPEKRADAQTCNPTCGRTLRRAHEYARRSDTFWAAVAAIGRPRHIAPPGEKRRALSAAPYRGSLA